jgi:hypothetical protein
MQLLLASQRIRAVPGKVLRTAAFLVSRDGLVAEDLFRSVAMSAEQEPSPETVDGDVARGHWALARVHVSNDAVVSRG